MSAIKGDLLLFARTLWNYDIDATAGGLWASTTIYRATVPAGKRWYVVGGMAYPHVNATVVVRVGINGGGTGLLVASYAAGAVEVVWPDATHTPLIPIIIEAGDSIEITFGAIQDATSYCTCKVYEVDV